MMINVRKILTVGFSISVASVALLVGACDMHHPTMISQNRMQVADTKIADEYMLDDMNDAAIKNLGQHYSKTENGMMELTVTYDPVSKTNTAMTAGMNAGRIADDLRTAGVENIKTSILPVHESGATSKVLVSYDAVAVLPPEDCHLMPGIDNVNIEPEADYKLGCSVDTILSRQIARPKDLKGNTLPDTSNGKRSVNIQAPYYSGKPNEPMSGGMSSTGSQ